MKKARYEISFDGVPEVERGEAEKLLMLAVSLARDSRVTAARRAHHGAFTSDSYTGYQTALNGAAGDYFTPAEAERVLFPAPLGNESANRSLSRALLNEDITYQAGPLREVLWQLYHTDSLRAVRAHYEKNG